MKRLFLSLAIGLAIAASPQPLSAQRKPANLPLKSGKTVLTPEQQRAYADLRKSSPTLFILKPCTPLQVSPYQVKPYTVRQQPPLRKATVNPNLVMWGDVISATVPGFHSFSPTSPVTVNRLNEYTQGYFNAGCGRVGNKLCGVYLDLTFQEYGFVQAYYFSMNTETWQVEDEPTPLSDFSLSAVETAQDPNTGEIFGEFRNANGTGLEWGVADYPNKTRSTIAQATNSYVALGIAQDGYAYGVAQDGNLYKIDRQTGAETKVGSTGVKVQTESGSAYFQSGEIDPKTNTFYWAATDADGTSALYTVDLTTGAAAKVGDYPSDYSGANFTGMVIPMPAADDGAPAAIADLKATFEGGALTGKVSFTAPSTTFDGKGTISGSLDYHLIINGKDTLKGKTEAGQLTAVDVTVPEGLNQFVAYTFNSAGKSPSAKASAFAGTDKPAAPTDVKFEVNDKGASVIIWTAAKGLNDGWLGDVKYDVARVAGEDTVWVGKDVTATTFEETVEQDHLKAYKYGVVAKNAKGQSTVAMSNEQLLGAAFEVPYFCDFDTSLDLYTVIDANNDGSTWIWDPATKAAAYQWNSTNAGDDWLISPPLHLKGGKNYKVSFKARSTNGALYPEKLEAFWGTGNSPELLKETLLEKTVLNGVDGYELFEKIIQPKEEGKYYLGFHAVSDAYQYYLYLDSVLVEDAPDANAPGVVTNLKAAGDPTGELIATLTFNAPTTTQNGGTLSSLTKIEVRKGDNIVGTVNNPTPGEAYTVTDNNATQGTNDYAVYAYNEAGAGPRATVSTFVGVDMPDMPTVSILDKTSSVTLSWDPVKGLNGGIIQPAKTRYDIFNVSPEGYVSDSVTSVTGVTEYEITGLSNDEGATQSYRTWAVRAANGAGESNFGVAAIVVGKPYTLPFHQSFKNATDEGFFMGINHGEGIYQWQITNETSVDNDGGSQSFFASEASSGNAYTGKITLKGAKNPHLLFYYKQGAENLPATLTALAEQRDGTMTKLFSYDFSNSTSTDWATALVKIPASLVAEDFVKIHFNVTTTDGLQGNKIYVDNINIVDPVKNDAAITLTAPDSIKKGQTLTAQLTLKNNGLDNLVNPRVTLTMNGKTLVDSTLNQTLGLLESAVIPVKVVTSSLDEDDKLTLKAEVTNEGDLVTDNNTATADVKALLADVSAPTDLRCTEQKDGNVTLAWTAPEVSYLTKTDDFESYDPWSISFGDWTTIDADNGVSQALSSMATYPHQGEAFAFIDWQPSDLFRTGAGLDPHSGKKALVSICQLNQTKTEYVTADNWLISPRLSGRAQIISFWVNNFPQQGYGTETFQVWASTTDNAQASFQQVGSEYTQSSGEWTKIDVELPEGTTYFAIRQTTSSDQAFIFMLDDITFEVANGATSYRVYREDAIRGTATEATYTDQGVADGNHDYAVTAIYPDGSESEPAVLNVQTTGINQTEVSKTTPQDVYSTTGSMVRRNATTLKGLPKGVYIVGSKKVVIK